MWGAGEEEEGGNKKITDQNQLIGNDVIYGKRTCLCTDANERKRELCQLSS